MSNYTQTFNGPLPSAAQMERAVVALETIASNNGGQIPTQIEYGVRFALSEDGNLASTTTGERVTRYAGAISPWEATYTPNVGDGTTVAEINEDEFELIPLFAPQLVTDGAGNVFRRFKPFYWGRQVMGGYLYIWVCESPLYSFYHMPQAFIRDGKVGYRDIGAYEGAFETIDETEYLCSKSGKNPAHDRNRTQFWNDAQAWQTYLSVDTAQEWYGITQISEITEIFQPLFLIKTATLNSQSIYKGVVSIEWNYINTGVSVLAYDESTMTLYFAENALDNYRVGGTACINAETSSEDYYRQITANGSVTGTIADNVFTPSEDGTTYYYITITGTSFPATPTSIWPRAIYTGETDVIEATSGTLSNNGKYSFKMFGIENWWGNCWKQILDVSVYNNVPQKLKDPYSYTEFSPSTYTQYYTAADYGVVDLAGRAAWITQMGWQDTMPDVQLPTATSGGSSTTYYCDYAYTNKGIMTCYYGDCLNNVSFAGLFAWNLFYSVGFSRWSCGARLSRWVLERGD